MLNTQAQLLRLLSKEFTSTVTMKDIPFIRFKKISPKSMVMWDEDFRLGNMWVDGITVERCLTHSCTMSGLINFLTTNGAKAMTKHPYERRGEATAPVYD